MPGVREEMLIPLPVTFATVQPLISTRGATASASASLAPILANSVMALTRSRSMIVMSMPRLSQFVTMLLR